MEPHQINEHIEIQNTEDVPGAKETKSAKTQPRESSVVKGQNISCENLRRNLKKVTNVKKKKKKKVGKSPANGILFSMLTGDESIKEYKIGGSR